MLMKAETIFKITMMGALVFYAAIIAGIGYGCYCCFDGLMFVTGFWFLARLVGGGFLALMFVIAALFWIFLLVCLIREIPGSSKPITDEEAAQFEEYIRNREEKNKK